MPPPTHLSETSRTDPVSNRAALAIPDPRGVGSFLRLSWHVDRRVLVISQWRGGVCVATTPVEVATIPGMVRLLVQALEEAATAGPSEGSAPTFQSLRRDAAALFRARLRPHVAPITEMTRRRGGRR